MLPLLFTLALAQPDVDDLDAWEQILSDALGGPRGCHDVRGTVSWEHRSGGQHNIGHAGFQVRFEDRRFGEFTLLDPVVDMTGIAAVDGDNLALQFRPMIGVGTSSMLISGPEGVFLRDAAADDTDRWVKAGTGTVWVEQGTEGVTTVHRAESLKERNDAPEATTVAYVLDGTEHAAFVYLGRDPHLQRGSLVEHRSRNAIYYRPDGLPAREVADVTFRLLRLREVTTGHEITYDAFTPCGADVADAPEGVRAVFTPRSSSDVPTITAAVDPRIATIEELRWEARKRRREAAYDTKWFALQAGLLGVAAGYVALQDPDQRPGTTELAVFGGIGAGALGFNLAQIVTNRRKAKKMDAEADGLEAELDAL